MQIQDVLAECARLYEEKKQLMLVMNGLGFTGGTGYRCFDGDAELTQYIEVRDAISAIDRKLNANARRLRKAGMPEKVLLRVPLKNGLAYYIGWEEGRVRERLIGQVMQESALRAS